MTRGMPSVGTSLVGHVMKTRARGASEQRGHLSDSHGRMETWFRAARRKKLPDGCLDPGTQAGNSPRS